MGIDINDLRKKQRKGITTKSSGDRQFNVDNLKGVLNKDYFSKKKFKTKQKAHFFSEFGTLLAAGVDLNSILNITISNNQDTAHQKFYKQIQGKIVNGSSMSEAMQQSLYFNNFDCYSVLIGENTGNLSHIFVKLGEYYNKRIVRVRKIKSALSYPIIVLITTMGAIWFMLKFVVPMFSQTLIKFGGELPKLTKVVIALSDNVSYYLLMVFILVSVTFLFWYRNRNNERLQSAVSSFILKIPYMGKYIYKSTVLEFTMAMNLLLSSRVTIVESLELVQKMSSFYPLKKALTNIKADIVKGGSFHKSMENQRFFERSMITLIKIGEEVNQLDAIFLRLSKQYEDELEYQSSVFMSVLEPLIIIILAVVVGVILVAMYLPMFKIGTVVH